MLNGVVWLCAVVCSGELLFDCVVCCCFAGCGLCSLSCVVFRVFVLGSGGWDQFVRCIFVCGRQLWIGLVLDKPRLRGRLRRAMLRCCLFV